MSLNATDLKGAYNTQRREGLFAQFDARGELREYGYFINAPDGTPSRAVVLKLAQGEPHGSLEDTTIDRFPSDDSDDPADLREWALRWASEIEREAQGIRSCSFCQKRQDQVRKLIAGPTQYICDECVRLCVDILEDPSGT
ncbi:MAG: hypothetical protein JO347_12975 [Candidatus Eremiobacteraeota bacterium]|nr:hypothetical protein [Candidatus Eremiobacteraeota bacterium]